MVVPVLHRVARPARLPRVGKRFPKGVVCFLRGGFLKVSGSSEAPCSEKVSLWLQVRDVNAVGRELEGSKVDIVEAPVDKPWG